MDGNEQASVGAVGFDDCARNDHMALVLKVSVMVDVLLGVVLQDLPEGFKPCLSQIPADT